MLFDLSESAWGYITVLIAMLFFGSFSIPLKLERTQRARPDPMVYQIYMNIAIFFSSFLVMSYNDILLTPWGILSAALWVFSSILATFAVTNAGLAVSQGTWAGCTIIVSFFWGAVIFQQPLSNLLLSLLALLMLMLAIAGISIAGSDLLVTEQKKPHVMDDPLPMADDPGYRPIEENTSPAKKKWIGIFCAAFLSITNGSMLAPIHYAPTNVQGINFIVSFGIGVLGVTPLFAVIYFIVFKRDTTSFITLLNPRKLLLPGLASGLGWNIGNWASIYATTFLGYTVGFPLSQCALLIGGFWGIVLFKEITGLKRISLFVISAFVLLGGAVLLALFGRK